VFKVILLKVTETGLVKGEDVDASRRVEVVASAEAEYWQQLPSVEQLVEGKDG